MDDKWFVEELAVAIRTNFNVKICFLESSTTNIRTILEKYKRRLMITDN